MKRYICIYLLLLCQLTMNSQTRYTYRYWFDNNLAAVQQDSINSSRWSIQIDVSGLEETLHQLYIQVRDTSGIWSAPKSSLFLKTAEFDGTMRARYWFDNDVAIDTTLTNGVQSVDVASLDPGLHFFQDQVIRTDGVYSPTKIAMFFKGPQTDGTMRARYWFDNDATIDTTMVNGVQSVDVASLNPGLHFFHYQVSRTDGVYSPAKTAMFIKEPETDCAMRARYWFDNDVAIDTTLTNGVQSVDVASLDPGLHFFHYQVIRADGVYSPTKTAIFVKGSADIVNYSYWINNDTDNCRMEVGNPKKSVFLLIDSLDVATYPIRPNAFHLEVNGGTPYIYSKNKLHARFYNSNSVYAEDSAVYIDSGSRQEVTGLLPLLSGTPRTDATPAANSIRWYRLEAYADNELGFRVSQPCTVQLFSPEGAVLLDVCGTAVTDTFSCRSTSGGSYYVALHDVTGTEDETTIEYLHEGHVLTFMVDGEVYSCDTLAYGVPVTAPELPEREGYSCTGWSEVPATMPAHDVTVTGSYVLNSVQTDAQGLIYTLADGRDAFTVSGYTDSLVADVAIPAELYGLPVSAIAEDALADAGVLASIVVPHSVERVGDDAFCGCTALLVVDWLATAPLSARSFDRPSSYGNMLVFVSDASTEVTFDGNIVTEGTARDIVLIDGLPFRNPRDFTADYISYSRDFTKPTEPGVAGGWEALVVPFDVERITSSSKGALAPIGLADHTSTLPSWVAEWADSTASFLLVDAIRANEPFIMSVPNSDKYEDKYNVQGTISFSAENAVVRSTEKCGYAASEGFSFVGSYEGVSCDATVYALNDEEYTAVDGMVYMAGGVFAPALRDVRPFESYATHEGVHKAPYLRIGGRDDTGIANVVISTTDDGWYTLQGVRLNGKPTDKGVYIHCGELIMVK